MPCVFIPLLLILLSLLISKLDSFCLPSIRLLFLVLFFFGQDLLHPRTSLLAFGFLLFLLSLTSSLIPRSRRYFNLFGRFLFILNTYSVQLSPLHL